MEPLRRGRQTRPNSEFGDFLSRRKWLCSLADGKK